MAALLEVIEAQFGIITCVITGIGIWPGTARAWSRGHRLDPYGGKRGMGGQLHARVFLLNPGVFSCIARCMFACGIDASEIRS